MEGLSNGKYHLSPFIAEKIFETAEAGDAAARQVVDWAGAELGWLAVAVTRQIGMENEAVEIVQSGSIFASGALLNKSMSRVVLEHVPKAQIIRLKPPPVIGSVLIGMGRRWSERLSST